MKSEKDFNCKRHKYTENQKIPKVIPKKVSYFFPDVCYYFKFYLHFYKLFFYLLLRHVDSLQHCLWPDMFLVDFQNLLCLRKHENIELWCFFSYDLVGLVLHQTQCNFRQSRSGSNSAFFRFGQALRRQLTSLMKSAHTSKSLRTRYNPASHSNRAEAPKLRRIRSPGSFRDTDVDLQKITAVFHKYFYVLIPNALLSFKSHLKW